MFGIDWGNQQTLWLNLTNLALGIVTLLALGLAGGVAQEVFARRRKAHEMQAWMTKSGTCCTYPNSA